MPASVASASTTAPRLTRRFCFIVAAETHSDANYQVQLNFHSLEGHRDTNSLLICNLQKREGGWPCGIRFLEGPYSFPKAPLGLKTGGSARHGTSETRGQATPGRPCY